MPIKEKYGLGLIESALTHHTCIIIRTCNNNSMYETRLHTSIVPPVYLLFVHLLCISDAYVSFCRYARILTVQL